MSHASQFSNLQLLTVSEIAVILRVSKMTIYRMIRNGDLESVRIGRAYRVPSASVRELLKDMGWSKQQQDEALAG